MGWGGCLPSHWGYARIYSIGEVVEIKDVGLDFVCHEADPN